MLQVLILTAETEQQRGGLPAVIEQAPLRPERRWRSPLAVAAPLLVIGGTAGIGLFWRQQHQPRLPPGIAWGNGRIEADEIDIDTKFAGRIVGLSVEEGAFVKAGQQVARMDTSDLEASLSKDEAQVRQAQRTLEEARANVEQQKAQVRLAHQQLDRTQFFGAERLGHQRAVGSAQTAAGCRELELGSGSLQARKDGARARCG